MAYPPEIPHLEQLEPGTATSRHLNSSNSQSKFDWMISRHDFFKSRLSRFWSRWCWFITLPNLAALLIIAVFIISIRRAGENGPMSEYGIVRYETNLDFLDDLDKRMTAMRREQEQLKESNVRLLSRMESQWTQNVISVKEEMEREIGKLKSMLADRLNSSDTCSSRVLETERLEMDQTVREVEERMKNAIEGVKTKMEKMSESIEKKAVSQNVVEKSPSRHNLASKKAGAYVVPELSSSQFIRGSIVHRMYANIWSLTSYQWPVTDRSSYSPGEAFCFEGSQGNVSVRLASLASLHSIQYEHDFWTNTVPISAPKEYDVMVPTRLGCSSVNDCSFELLSQCYYGKGRGGTAQDCVFENPSDLVDLVQLRVNSNHGQDYTCIYNIKVFGVSQEE